MIVEARKNMRRQRQEDSSQTKHDKRHVTYRPCLAQLSFTGRAVFWKNNFMSNFMSRGELCFCSFTMCLTL
jgi:hypothetical protein